MTVTEFKKIIEDYNKEICCNGKTTASHSYPSSVYFYLEENDEIIPLELYEQEPLQHGGCNCWTGIIFTFVKKKKNFDEH